MISNAGAAQRTARVIYPELPDRLTPDDMHRLFSPSCDERKWAPSVARTPASQVALLVQLKIFQTIGRFRRATDIPVIVFAHVANSASRRWSRLPVPIAPDTRRPRQRAVVRPRSA
jgi:hypothetical protein